MEEEAVFHLHSNKLSVVQDEAGEMVIKHLVVGLQAPLPISTLRTNRASHLWIIRVHLPVEVVSPIEEEEPQGVVVVIMLLEEPGGGVVVKGVASRLIVEGNEGEEEVGEIGKR